MFVIFFRFFLEKYQINRDHQVGSHVDIDGDLRSVFWTSITY